jgi:fatty-acid desaturase
MFGLSFSNKLRLLHIFNHLMVVVGLIYGSWWGFVAAFFIWQFIAIVGVSLGFHRYWSHGSFKTHKWFEIFMTYVGCLACGGTPLGWSGAHRLHHKHTDTEKDPHSPTQLGFWRTYLHIWKPFHIPPRSIRDLLKNKHIRFCHKHYFKMLLSWMVLLFLMDPMFLIFGFCIPGAVAFHAYGLINAVSHTYGYRGYETKDKTSRNNWFANIFTGGEGWHNNHHKFQNRYRIGIEWWEYDPGAWLLETFGLIKK